MPKQPKSNRKPTNRTKKGAPEEGEESVAASQDPVYVPEGDPLLTHQPSGYGGGDESRDSDDEEARNALFAAIETEIDTSYSQSIRSPLRFKESKRKRDDGGPGSPGSKGLEVSHSAHPPPKKSKVSGSRALLGTEICDAIANVVRQEIKHSLEGFSKSVERLLEATITKSIQARLSNLESQVKSINSHKAAPTFSQGIFQSVPTTNPVTQRAQDTTDSSPFASSSILDPGPSTSSGQMSSPLPHIGQFTSDGMMAAVKFVDDSEYNT